MITLENGLKNSLIILEHLRNNEALSDVTICVGCFTNCREVGLTFAVLHGGNFTFCVYEHRNSDSIIINGAPGFVCNNGDLPYIGETKHEYLAEFQYNEHREAADKLAELILDFYNKEIQAKTITDNEV